MILGGGKSNTLALLAPHLKGATVPPFLTISCHEWREDSCAAVQACVKSLNGDRYAVRSDAHGEDGALGSQAGRFLSILDVPATALSDAIDRVFNSMPGHAKDKVIVQHMVNEVMFAGVASTHRISDGAPWFCIELAAKDCVAVTAGRASGRMYAIARNAPVDFVVPGIVPAEVLAPLSLVREIEQLIGDPQGFEIEFAVSSASPDAPSQVHLLQARPITVPPMQPSFSATQATSTLPDLNFLQEADSCQMVKGRATVLSLMSDWNPAELIGCHPRPLSLSLFEHLVSDSTWWQARATLGYAQVPAAGLALLHPLAGRPWVDVRRSANSLLPAGLPASIATYLIDHWIENLRQHPERHDKVEFTVFRTVKDFYSMDEVRRRWAPGLVRTDLALWDRKLGQIGRELVNRSESSPLMLHLATIDALHRCTLSGLTWPALLHNCKLAAFAFSVLARLAFVAQAQLQSAIVRGAVDVARAMQLRASARSTPVLNQIQGNEADLWQMHGSMRPGSFDITQLTWAEQAWDTPPSTASSDTHFSFSAVEHRAMSSLLRDAHYDLTPEQWLAFAQDASRAREWGKFVLGRQLSACLDGIAGTMSAEGLDREQASWLSLAQIDAGLALDSTRRPAFWREQIGQASSSYAAQAQVIVSPVLRQTSDRLLADSLGIMPNFIGRQVAQGRIAVLDAKHARPTPELTNAIVVIDKADPGFDWLFHCKIAGLITAWGGANSHMAIRCAEFKLSAAIGCGEAVLRQANRASYGRIDPQAGGLWLQ